VALTWADEVSGTGTSTKSEEAGGLFGDKGFIGTDYITTPIRKPECRELLQWEQEWNNQVSSFRAYGAARCHLEDMADALHRLSPTVEDLQVIIPRGNRTLLLQREFRITLHAPSYGSIQAP
jgi:hypothetical protein